MMMSLLELDLQLRIEKEAGERTKDMKEVSDQKEQRLENLDNPHAVLWHWEQTDLENISRKTFFW